jgi:hypothetical protein
VLTLYGKSNPYPLNVPFVVGAAPGFAPVPVNVNDCVPADTVATTLFDTFHASGVVPVRFPVVER